MDLASASTMGEVLNALLSGAPEVTIRLVIYHGMQRNSTPEGVMYLLLFFLGSAMTRGAVLKALSSGSPEGWRNWRRSSQ